MPWTAFVLVFKKTPPAVVALGWSQVAEKVSNDIDRASYSSRQKQQADGQPEEAAKTLKLALSS